MAVSCTHWTSFGPRRRKKRKRQRKLAIGGFRAFNIALLDSLDRAREALLSGGAAEGATVGGRPPR